MEEKKRERPYPSEAEICQEEHIMQAEDRVRADLARALLDAPFGAFRRLSVWSALAEGVLLDPEASQRSQTPICLQTDLSACNAGLVDRFLRKQIKGSGERLFPEPYERFAPKLRYPGYNPGMEPKPLNP